MPKNETSELAIAKLNYNNVRFEVLAEQLYIYKHRQYLDTRGIDRTQNVNKAVI